MTFFKNITRCKAPSAYSVITAACIQITVMNAAAPDTANIPAKWKNESVIVLEHTYRADESSFNDAKYSEYHKIVYYIRDKYGLQELSTFNIPTYIVPGAEMQIGKVYKKNKTVVELTSRHLIPMYTKIDLGNRRRSSSTRKADNGQKLAIPSLEVGDILEIEYTSRRKEIISYLNLDVRYPTLKSDLSISVKNDGGMYNASIKYKAVNYPNNKVEATPQTVTVSRTNVERTENESLSDENKTQPYVVVWKSYKSAFENSTSDAEQNKNYLELIGDDQKREQRKFTNYFYADDLSEFYVAIYLEDLINKKHKKIADTLAFLNDLFYTYREMIAMKSLTESATKTSYANDKYFVDVMSRVLFEKGVPFKVFVSQPDYYGAPLSEHDIISARYGIINERNNYFMFNPFAYLFPNQVPSYFEDQTYVMFNANPHFYPKGESRKYCKYGFTSGTFPHSTSNQNLTETTINVSAIDLTENTCVLELNHSYWGKNKNRVTKNMCSNTLLYELADNDYRALVKKHYPTYISLDVDSDKHDWYLKNHLLEDIKGDGYDPLKLKFYKVDETNFFDATKPISTNYAFISNNIVVNYDNYLILNVGKLLGSQLQYKRNDSVRQTNFFIPYKKKYTFLIRIEIPEGYKVENMADLDTKFISPAGKFETKASVNGRMLEIKTEKNYEFIDYPGSDEKHIKGFLDLATEFTQKKLVLKKS